MSGHPSDLDLELLRTGEADAAVAAHVEGCAPCRERLSALRSLARELVRPLAPLEVPRALDEALARLAREQGALVRRRQVEHRGGYAALRRVVPRAAAACAVLGLGLFLAARAMQPRSAPLASAPGAAATRAGAPLAARAGALADDVNADGRVDVVDAYLVALAVDRGRAPERFDRNGDGRVDRRDAERLALLAVSLGGFGD